MWCSRRFGQRQFYERSHTLIDCTKYLLLSSTIRLDIFRCSTIRPITNPWSFEDDQIEDGSSVPYSWDRIFVSPSAFEFYQQNIRNVYEWSTFFLWFVFAFLQVHRGSIQLTVCLFRKQFKSKRPPKYKQRNVLKEVPSKHILDTFITAANNISDKRL